MFLRTCAAMARLAVASSLRMVPSRNTTERLQKLAISASWVTSTMVRPRSSFNFWKISITSTEVRLSRLPVGSSVEVMEIFQKRSEEHTSEQSPMYIVCGLLLEKTKENLKT